MCKRKATRSEVLIRCPSPRLLIKGARVLEFDKLGEICGHFQELNFAKGKCGPLELYCDPEPMT